MSIDPIMKICEKFHLVAGMPFLLKELYHLGKHTLVHGRQWLKLK